MEGMESPNPSDIEMISNLSRALWAEEGRSTFTTGETFSATSLMDFETDTIIEETCRAMLKRAEQDGNKVNLKNLDNPFYRLDAEDRFILSLLHLSDWSYAKIARVLRRSEVVVSRSAWAARLHLGTLVAPDLHPHGSAVRGPHCPSYDPMDPWTQKFLDEEIRGENFHNLQLHLMNCPSCRGALNRCRDLYYKVEGVIPELKNEKALKESKSYLNSIWRQSQRAKGSGRIIQSFEAMFERQDIQLAFFLLITILLCKYFVK